MSGVFIPVVNLVAGGNDSVVVLPDKAMHPNSLPRNTFDHRRKSPKIPLPFVESESHPIKKLLWWMFSSHVSTLP
jgi:hypothetical protein